MIHIKNAKSKITNIDDKCFQPNAVDFKLEKVFAISDDVFEISEEYKKHRSSKEIKPDENGWFYLEPGTYDIASQSTIKITEGEAGWVIQRSTLNRNGIQLFSGLYDSGYNGVLGCVMVINCGPLKIKKGTRIGQFLLFNAESIGVYDGDYGIDKEHDKKYIGENNV